VESTGHDHLPLLLNRSPPSASVGHCGVPLSQAQDLKGLRPGGSVYDVDPSPTKGPTAGAPAQSETRDPHDRQHDGSDPQQMNSKSGAEKNQYQ